MVMPVVLSRTSGSVRTPTSEAGQHTDEILGELGYAKKDIERLRKDGVV